MSTAGRIESWNQGAAQMFAYLAARIVGQPLASRLGGGEAAKVTWNWLMSEVQRAGSIRSYKLTTRDAAGHDINVELTLTNLAGANHAALGPSVILRDVTDRKRSMAEI